MVAELLAKNEKKFVESNKITNLNFKIESYFSKNYKISFRFICLLFSVGKFRVKNFILLKNKGKSAVLSP